MEYDDEAVQRIIDRAVGSHDGEPAFYAVAGSRIYGFSSEADSDVDVRGFHVADGRRYALLDEPTEQIIVNQDGITEGFEAYADVDLVSYELKKFGRLVADGNFNVLEAMFCGDQILNDVPAEIQALQSLVEEYLPMDVPTSYYGMAKNNYRTYLDPDGENYQPTAKMFLYVIRGLLAAQYVMDAETIEADVHVLADAILGETNLVEELTAVKRDEEMAAVPDDLAVRATEQIDILFDEIDPPERGAKTDFCEAVDDWMLTVRA